MTSERPAPKADLDWQQQLTDHRDWLVAVARRRLGSLDDAEEVIQDVSLSVMQQQQRPEAEEAVRSWLYQITIRRIADFFRAQYRRETFREDVASEDTSREEGPVDVVLAAERSAGIQSAINEIPSAQQQVLALKYTEGLSYRDIAKRMKLSERSVEYLLVQAKQNLRSQLIASKGM